MKNRLREKGGREGEGGLISCLHDGMIHDLVSVNVFKTIYCLSSLLIKMKPG